jgi:hypothetical protein
MNYFCTLFDSYYLNRGLVMHQSLLDKCRDFHLYIFAFDDLSYDILTRLDLARVTIISLKEFENEELLGIKPTRTKAEYCWTCTPSTISYCLDKFNLPHCTYIDADLLFFSDPIVLIQEMNDKSVQITEHRYTPEYDQSATSGIYCVQFVTFKNNAAGKEVLCWWTDRCIEWCYNRHEDGKFGDQKYLDDWTTRFEGVQVQENPGGGVAPWNVQQFDLFKSEGNWLMKEKKSGKIANIIFYHFHHLTFFLDKVDLSDVYDLKEKGVRQLYDEYLMKILKTNEMLRRDFGFHAPFQKFQNEPVRDLLKRTAVRQYRKWFGNYNIVDLIELKKRHREELR